MKHWISYLAVVILAMACATEKKQPTEPSPEITTDWEEVKRPCNAHLRGLDIAGDGTIWASGTEGTVLKSADSGKTWSVYQIEHARAFDLRDIEAIDSNTAITMSSGNGVRMYKTTDGGRQWSLAYENADSAQFFDALDFNGSVGWAYGDPQDGAFQLLASQNQGDSWAVYDANHLPSALSNEGGYAASGTGLILTKSWLGFAVGGGTHSRFIRAGADSSWQAFVVPMTSSPGAGIFSMAFWSDDAGIAVGGNYVDSTRSDSNAAYTTDGGIHWNLCQSSPSGYRSCGASNHDGSMLIATGRTGTDISTDGGKTWQLISENGYFSAVIIEGQAIGVGRYGKIGVLELEHLTP